MAKSTHTLTHTHTHTHPWFFPANYQGSQVRIGQPVSTADASLVVPNEGAPHASRLSCSLEIGATFRDNTCLELQGIFARIANELLGLATKTDSLTYLIVDIDFRTEHGLKNCRPAAVNLASCLQLCRVYPRYPDE